MSAYTQSYFYRKVYFSNSSVTTTPSSGVAVPGADETLTFFILPCHTFGRLPRKLRDYACLQNSTNSSKKVSNM